MRAKKTSRRFRDAAHGNDASASAASLNPRENSSFRLVLFLVNDGVSFTMELADAAWKIGTADGLIGHAMQGEPHIVRVRRG